VPKAPPIFAPIPQPRRHRQPFSPDSPKTLETRRRSPISLTCPTHHLVTLTSPSHLPKPVSISWSPRFLFLSGTQHLHPAGTFLNRPSAGILGRGNRSWWQSCILRYAANCLTASRTCSPSPRRPALNFISFTILPCLQLNRGSPTDTLTQSAIPDKASGPSPRHLLQPWRDSFLVAAALLSAERRFFPGLVSYLPTFLSWVCALLLGVVDSLLLLRGFRCLSCARRCSAVLFVD
jgi:hypothetical protein